MNSFEKYGGCHTKPHCDLYNSFHSLCCRLPISISFQQSTRPVPAKYTLSTQFQLTNSRRLFLQDPQSSATDLRSDFRGIFDKSEYYSKIMGSFWHGLPLVNSIWSWRIVPGEALSSWGARYWSVSQGQRGFYQLKLESQSAKHTNIYRWYAFLVREL